MKNITISLLAIFILANGYAQNSIPLTQKNDQHMLGTEKKAIESLLNNYEQALNASDTQAVLALYTEDGVFMPSEAPTSIGKVAVGQAYNYVFSQIKLNIKFSVDEIIVEGDWAFARTGSKGTTDVLAAKITVPEENRELFVLKKDNGIWKIARYIFNKMRPKQ